MVSYGRGPLGPELIPDAMQICASIPHRLTGALRTDPPSTSGTRMTARRQTVVPYVTATQPKRCHSYSQLHGSAAMEKRTLSRKAEGRRCDENGTTPQASLGSR